MVDERWDVFTKRVLIAKLIIDISAPLAPSADAYVYTTASLYFCFGPLHYAEHQHFLLRCVKIDYKQCAVYLIIQIFLYSSKKKF